MEHSDSKDQTKFDLGDTDYITSMRLVDDLLMQTPIPPAYYFRRSGFCGEDDPVYTDVELNNGNGSMTSIYQFECFPVGGFLNYISSVYISDKGVLTYFKKEGFTSHSKTTTTTSKSISAGYDGWSLKLGTTKTTEQDKTESKELQVTVNFDFEQGNYFIYQTSVLMCYKLGEQYKNQANAIYNSNKDDLDMHFSGDDLYFFVAKHRNDANVSPIDNDLECPTQQEVVNYLLNDPETWAVATSRTLVYPPK